MDKDKVIALSKLARIEISDMEAESLAREFGDILGYVGEVKSVSDSADSIAHKPALRNIFREDMDPHESGRYTEAILAEAPSREGDFVAVKKILS